MSFNMKGLFALARDVMDRLRLVALLSATLTDDV